MAPSVARPARHSLRRQQFRPPDLTLAIIVDVACLLVSMAALGQKPVDLLTTCMSPFTENGHPDFFANMRVNGL
jgi:hypothetical protein